MKKFLIILIYLPVYIIIFLTATSYSFSFDVLIEILCLDKVQSALLVSLTYSLVVAIINLVVGIWVGSAMSRHKGKFLEISNIVTLVPLIIPTILVLSGLHIFMIKIGLVDSMISVILINLLPTIPYSIKICQNAYTDLGTKYFEQSRMLGANSFKSFFLVSVPLLKEAYQYVFLLSFVIALSQYAITAIIGGGKVVTLAMVYFPFFNSLNNMHLAAFSLIFMCLPFLVMLLFKFIYYIVLSVGKLV